MINYPNRLFQSCVYTAAINTAGVQKWLPNSRASSKMTEEKRAGARLTHSKAAIVTYGHPGHSEKSRFPQLSSASHLPFCR